MIPIHKNQENPLLEFERIPGVTYDDNRLPKKELKASLLKEQGYLCAYCMSRIYENSMKIEHWLPQNPDNEGCELSSEEKEANRQHSIDYKNLLAVCKGEEGKQSHLQHCDTKKGNKRLLYNPANPDHYNKLRIKYLRTGKIESEDSDFNEQLGDEKIEYEKNTNEGILNLNCSKLMSNRADVINKIIDTLNQLKNRAPSRQIDSILEKWCSPDRNGRLQEYAGVAIYFLTKRRKIRL
ncbi:hypothetical protein [Desulfovibrio sp. An276]|uniref:hypothetical protein n=1 Tax=Desulfovibrio sp. An276 TaxID=1965618 RepID=UPI0011864C6D|nr:hypothetical protein [Desulfovibrio sp. An276]